MKKKQIIELPYKIESDIVVQNGIVFSHMKLNGKKRLFLIDSGAPSIILNEQHVSKKQLLKSKKTFQGVSGKGHLSHVVLKSLNWKGLSIQNKRVNAINLAHIEVHLKEPFHGLLGYAELSHFSFQIDYKLKKMFLWREFNKDDFSIVGEIPFVLHNHIPVISVEIEGKPLKLGLDTGAAVNLIDIQHLDKLKKGQSNRKKDTLRGADTKEQSVEKSVVNEMMVHGFSFKKMRVLWPNIKHLQTAFGNLDGLLGYEFLKKKKMVVSYADKRIYLVRKKRNS